MVIELGERTPETPRAFDRVTFLLACVAYFHSGRGYRPSSDNCARADTTTGLSC